MATVARLAQLMAGEPVVTPFGTGAFSVEVGGARESVYVAGPPDDRWASWNGHVFHSAGIGKPASTRDGVPRTPLAQSLTAPMPATVMRVLVAPGGGVRKGDAVVLLEAMKMELPVRSLSDGTVTAVHCHEGELVKADQVLVELE